MLILRAVCPPFATNSYLAICEETCTAVVIDPGFGSLEALSRPLVEKSLKLSAILLTHSHWDHIAEVSLWQKSYPVPACLHSLDLPNLEQPGADFLPMIGDIIGSSFFTTLEEGQEIQIGQSRLTVIHTPGHSPGSLCFYSSTEKLLFSGDTLFHGTIGNLSFPTSVPKLMRSSLDKLQALPPTTKVYPGHGEATTLEAEASLLKYLLR